MLADARHFDMTSPPSSTPAPLVTADPFGIGVAFASLTFDEAELWATQSELHLDEQRFIGSLPTARRASFLAGRRALRAALQTIAPDRAIGPLLHTSRGAPALPPGLRGSISHKRRRAIAIASLDADAHFGVDLEERPRDADLSRPSIARRVLTEAERAVIESLDPLAHREATLIRFALKEAVYKAIDPLVQRYVQFLEVELHAVVDGRAQVALRLPELENNAPAIEARWSLDDDYIVAVASCRATPPPR